MSINLYKWNREVITLSNIWHKDQIKNYHLILLSSNHFAGSIQIFERITTVLALRDNNEIDFINNKHHYLRHHFLFIRRQWSLYLQQSFHPRVDSLRIDPTKRTSLTFCGIGRSLPSRISGITNREKNTTSFSLTNRGTRYTDCEYFVVSVFGSI